MEIVVNVIKALGKLRKSHQRGDALRANSIVYMCDE